MSLPQGIFSSDILEDIEDYLLLECLLGYYDYLYLIPLSSYGLLGYFLCLLSAKVQRKMGFYLIFLSSGLHPIDHGLWMRNNKKYNFRCPDLKDLRKLSSFVLDPLDFKQHHGKLLYVLSTDVVEGLLSVLVQFYDPLYRCFTFLDYQLVPMLEEYAHLLGMPVSNKVHFNGLKEIPVSHVIAGTLHLKKSEIDAHLIYFFAQFGSFDAFEAIFVLLIYGLALFPNIDGFVDVNAIRIFLIRNLVPTLLGYMYFSFHLRNSKGGGTIV
ncbi:hypothetical protein KIW84_012401 [Lathyrus oleraceus]|uniref:DUF7745 domain-containing protein n=1 Tax=Pisum sativum TaxID=3888 RepID=A0A9D5GWK2_PEA|nr:hypothetical protein KIW84_012401 [Pisum sativum]